MQVRQGRLGRGCIIERRFAPIQEAWIFAYDPRIVEVHGIRSKGFYDHPAPYQWPEGFNYLRDTAVGLSNSYYSELNVRMVPNPEMGGRALRIKAKADFRAVERDFLLHADAPESIVRDPIS